jgi:hypothetical protein
MANALQLRRGTTTQHNTFTGLAGEVTVDTDKETVVVHDGSTAGGFPLARASDLTNFDADTLDGKQLATIESEYQTFANTAAANVVDSAPGTLDTLNELAAALGDDPNFATTVTNSIATKMPLAGGTFTGGVSGTTASFGTVTATSSMQLGDNVKAQFGASNDLQIYHTGSHSYIHDAGTGNLRLKGTNINIESNAGHDIFQGIEGGAATMYHNNAAKLATASNGITVTGNVAADSISLNDNDVAYFGTSNDLQIYHDGTHSYIADVGTGNLDIRTNGARVYIGKTNGENSARFDSDGPVILYHDNSQKLETVASGVEITGTLQADGVTVDGTLDIEEVYEKVQTSVGTSGTIGFETDQFGVLYYTNNQAANRTINFQNVNANLGVGQSVTCTVLLTQGGTAYYLNAYQVDGSAVTPKWSGGEAPTEGNASGIDVYTFTIIKTANATFTVLASQSQYA